MTGNVWVTWKNVARFQRGTARDAPLLQAYASFFNNQQQVFRSSGNGFRVKLTPTGQKIANALVQQPMSKHEQIACAVTQYAGGLKSIQLNVQVVQPVAIKGGKHVAAIELDVEGHVDITGAPVTLRPKGPAASVQGKVISQEPDGGIVYIAFISPINGGVSGDLLVDRGYLLGELGQALRSLDQLPELVKPLWEQNAPEKVVADEDSVEVALELSRLEPPWMRLLWGPPGAGKTYGIAYLVREIVAKEPGRRTLIVAPANLAVDVALKHVVGRFEDTDDRYYRGLVQDRRITRYGYARDPGILNREELMGPRKLDNLSAQIRQLSQQIKRKERRGDSSSDEIALLRAELLSLQEEIKRSVKQHLEKSWVVATTTTQAYLSSSPIRDIEWDTVIVDEVTMATPALCTFLGSLARRRFLLAGDPRQLGPIFQNHFWVNEEVEKWMGKDVFVRSGVAAPQKAGGTVHLDDGRLAQIRSQRRCAPSIWSRVKSTYPKVESNPDAKRIDALRALPPREGNAFVLLDTSPSGGMNRAKKIQGSWKNEYSAALAMEVASAIGAESSAVEPSIAIISPYRAQTYVLQKWMRAENRVESPIFENVMAGTVHQFQGSEADVVIFDLVDSPGRSHLGFLLRGEIGTRLVTVAATRARGKLIVIADRKWFQAKASPQDNRLLWRLVTDIDTADQMDVVPPSTDGKAASKKLRRCESPIDKELLKVMRCVPELEDVKPQYVIHDDSGGIVSRADFAFPEVKFAVYCDGARWHLKHRRWRRDWRIRNKLQELGWAFSVFPGSDIKQYPDQCVRQVLSTYRSLQ